ncbi:MAG: GNAT family N-acetyltransferase [Chloroflexi bacterium]|nr:GNAT family N-acetyltransferase [Chloroflexota bacterium]
MRHPHHDAVAASIRAAYAQPHPEMGWAVEERAFGLYRRNVKAGTYPSVLLRNVSPADVSALLDDVRQYFAGSPQPVRIVIEDREADAALGPALEAAGLQLDERTTFVAHVGAAPEAAGVPGVSVEPVADGGLAEYEDTRVRGFANADDPPPEDLGSRVDLRRAEMAGEAHYWLARVDGEPAAVLSWYDGEDRLIFSLATRVPFRNRGLARHLLCRLLGESERQGTRSVVISGDEAGTPIDLYRRLGFTDEVYWNATYELELS